MNELANPRQTSPRIDHFYARADRWRDLVNLARSWANGHCDREVVAAAFDGLAIQEEFHAFPGQRLIAALRDKLYSDKDSAASFAAIAHRVSAAIVTRDYKHDASEWETDDSADVP